MSERVPKSSPPAVVSQQYAMVAVGDLKPHPKNPRKGAVQAIDESIAANGFYGAIVAQKSTSLILAGRHRWERAAAAGIAEVPVLWVDADDATALRIVLVDNRTQDLAGYDSQALAELLESVRNDTGSFDGTGYDEAAYNEILAVAGDAILAASGGGAKEEEPPQIDRAEEFLAKWPVQLGQVWEIGTHRLLCGDSRDGVSVQRLMAGKKAAWMWTDPPYGVSYVGKTRDALTIQNDATGDLPGLLLQAFGRADAVLMDGAPFYIAHADKAVLQFRAAVAGVGWHHHQTLIWVKNSLVMGHCDYQYQHEPILYGWKENPSGERWLGSLYDSRPWYGERNKVTLLRVDRPSRSDTHPTMKPVDLIKRCLENSSRAGSLGFDPFAGSGSTMVAAHELGRACAAIELEPKYCAVICDSNAKTGSSPEAGRVRR